MIFLSIGLMIWGAIYLSKDTKKHNEESTNWVLAYILVGMFTQLHFIVLGIYFLKTNRKGKGIFWIIGFPILCSIPFIALMVMLTISAA